MKFALWATWILTTAAWTQRKGPCETKDQGILAPHFYPIPQFRLFLGPEDEPCKFLSDCEEFSKGFTEWPEYFIIEAMVANLGHCWFPGQKCAMLDFGANLGYVNSYASALGARVVSIEPQADLVLANRLTTQKNCWHRSHHIHGFLTLKDTLNGQMNKQASLWRPHMNEYHTVQSAPFVYIGSMLQHIEMTNIDFVKIDVDSFDLDILENLLARIEQGSLNVTTFVIETQGKGSLFTRAVALGYHLYRLDHHERVRFFDSRGRDVYKLRGCPAPLGDFREENFCRRGIQYLIKFPGRTGNQAWTSKEWDSYLSQGRNSFEKGNPGPGGGTFMITKINLETPQVMENWSKENKAGAPPLKGSYNNEYFGDSKKEQVNPIPSGFSNWDEFGKHDRSL